MKSSGSSKVIPRQETCGEYLGKMWGLPQRPAIWHAAKPEQKKRVGGLMVSAALTSFLTGITEPGVRVFVRGPGCMRFTPCCPRRRFRFALPLASSTEPHVFPRVD